jgi:hypothetical protein
MTESILKPRTVKLSNWIILGLLTGCSWVLGSRDFALGVLVGGVLAALNFHAMAYLLSATLAKAPVQGDWQGAGRRAALAVAVKYFIRFTILAVIMYVLVKNGWVNVFGLLVGLSTVVINLIVLVCVEVHKIYSKEALAVDGTSNSVS